MSKPVLSVLACLALSVVPASSGACDDDSTPEALVGALYDVISGPAGKERDPDRMRSLFYEGARMVSVGGAQDGKVRHRVLTVEDYIERSFPFLERNGFFETQIKSVTERYGNIVHVFSTYESRNKKDDEEPFARGINSLQLMNDGERWWIMSIVWQSEVPGLPVPRKYLPDG